MPTHGKGSKIFLAEYDVSGQSRSFEPKWDKSTAKKGTFGDEAYCYTEGEMSASISHKGIFDLLALSWDRWLYDNLGSFSGKGITVIPGVPAVGGIAYNGEVKEASSGRPVSISDIVAVEAEYKIHGMLGRAKIIEYEIDAAVGAQTGAGVDLGIASASEMWFYTIHLIEFNATGTYSFTFADSPDDLVWSDLPVLNFGALGGLLGTYAGARQRYIRVSTTVAGGTPTAKFIVAVSIVPLQ